MLHVENTDSVNGVINWVENGQRRGVAFDVLGLSAYEAFQGPSTAWASTLDTLASTFPDLSFSIAEYNPERRLPNDRQPERLRRIRSAASGLRPLTPGRGRSRVL